MRTTRAMNAAKAFRRLFPIGTVMQMTWSDGLPLEVSVDSDAYALCNEAFVEVRQVTALGLLNPRTVLISELRVST